MKRTKPAQIYSGLVELHVASHDVNKVKTALYFINLIIGQDS